MLRSVIVKLAFVVVVTALATPVLAVEADDILGLWATEPGTENGQAHVELRLDDGSYHGRIVWLEKPTYPPDDERGMGGQTRIDRNNPDPARQRDPIIGLEIVKGFVFDGDGVWHKGTIYDPDNGKTYKCKMWLDEAGVLRVRGFIGFSLLGRTTEWTRVSAGQ